MKYGRQRVRVYFMRYVAWKNRLLPSANQHRTLSNINAYSFYNSLLHHHPDSKASCRPGLPEWPFHGQFRKIWPFFNCAGHEKNAFGHFLAIFSVCHCKIKFSLNILSFCIFSTVFVSLIFTVTPWHLNLLLLGSV